MGQRHQIFLKVVNPVALKACDFPITKKLINLFGENEFTILPFHNQWLYGRTALNVAHNVLNHCSQFTVGDKVDNGFGAYYTPFSKKGLNINEFKTYMDWVKRIEFIMNYIPVKKSYIDAGFLRSWYLGEDSPIMRNDFTMGDNNDGITIIDTIENKYCFMNIYEQTLDYSSNSGARVLPELQPVSAAEYVRAYYVEEVDKLQDYYKERANTNNKTAEDVCAENIKENKPLIKLFNKFNVLTIEEIVKMFPKMEEQLLVKSK